jgi:antirestriction protein ArdC
LGIMKEDNKAIVKAAFQAQKAADFILELENK